MVTCYKNVNPTIILVPRKSVVNGKRTSQA